ncbi:PAS domain-containing protein [Calothrix sp. UHCC 0171]|uniref:PAS domain-containing protein n=1 Tax=Calothrix sp. UHCC 0171 TaxID=3110245 RepID=UPI002B21DA29|nr:PAS domain-containing protein [Calothrix sp. UHCC 0171]MEA5572472.1 PAS domain-containing protein [Calothrix sp. UHCC 0171]
MAELILIVDDDAVTRGQLRELLQQAGYSVAEASDGEEALDIYQQLKPDMVLLDALMERMDGFTCCQLLRNLENNQAIYSISNIQSNIQSNIPILMITVLSDQNSVDRAFAAGATDYITKPIHWQVLRQRVRHLLESKRTVEELHYQTEQAKRREAQLMMALQSAQMGIWDWDIANDRVIWSDNKEALFGLEKGSFAGTYEAFLRSIYPEDRDLVVSAIQDAVKQATEYDIEFRALLPDGTIRWMASKGVVFYDDAAVPVAMSGVDTDITKRKEAESALETYANRQALVAELSQLALAGIDLTTLMQQSVNAIAASLGVDFCNVLELQEGENNLLLRVGVGWQPELLGTAKINSEFAQALLANESFLVYDFTTESRFIPPDLLASQNIVSCASVLIHGKELPFGVLGVYGTTPRDFSRDEIYFLQAIANVLAAAIERRFTEERLRQSEERFQIVAQATNDVIWDWNLETNSWWWNENVQTLFGYLPSHIDPYVTWWRDRIHPKDKRRIISDIQSVIDHKQQVWSNEYRFRCADGSYAYIFDRAYVVRDSSGKPIRVIGAMMDISERKRVQEQLQRQNLRSQLFADFTLKIRQSLQIEEILRTSVNEVQKLLNSDRVVMLRFRANGAVTAVQEAVKIGFPVVLGRDIVDPCFGEEYLDKYRQGRISAIANIAESDIQPCHRSFLQQFAVQANLVVPILLQNHLWGFLIAHQCSHPRVWTSWEIELLRQLADQIGIALAQAKLLEQETLQRQELARSNEELQQFAFIASHDLQEPLRKIQAFGDRLKVTCEGILPERANDYLERMLNAAQRMQALIDDLLTLSRVTTRAQPFIPINLRQITQEVLSDLEVRIQQSHGKIELGYLPTIKGDPLQIRQLLQNLIGNALKFHLPNKVPIVSIYSEMTTGEDSEEICHLTVEDNGIGFDEKYCDRIFQVFQRLHGRSEYEGTGIGLAICRKIVERHQGSITVQSQPGQGTKFIVTLPSHISFA